MKQLIERFWNGSPLDAFFAIAIVNIVIILFVVIDGIKTAFKKDHE